ncbi:MAG: hypothetical protein FWC27_08280 [Firmicutes bacterium]|nr:hypothetical protein [Bacillota bacterium]
MDHCDAGLAGADGGGTDLRYNDGNGKHINHCNDYKHQAFLVIVDNKHDDFDYNDYILCDDYQHQARFVIVNGNDNDNDDNNHKAFLVFNDDDHHP